MYNHYIFSLLQDVKPVAHAGRSTIESRYLVLISNFK